MLLLEEVGFDRETVGKVLVRCPEIFATSVERTLKGKLEFLASIGISKGHLPRVIKKYPEVLVSDVEGTLLPRYVPFPPTRTPLENRDFTVQSRLELANDSV